MPAVVETSSGASASQAGASVRRYDWLKPYQFKKGDPGNPRKVNPLATRQPGTPNAQTIYLESLPIKARQWVKSTSPAVLIDARKLAIPDADQPVMPENLTIVIVESLR